MGKLFIPRKFSKEISLQKERQAHFQEVPGGGPLPLSQMEGTEHLSLLLAPILTEHHGPCHRVYRGSQGPVRQLGHNITSIFSNAKLDKGTFLHSLSTTQRTLSFLQRGPSGSCSTFSVKHANEFCSVCKPGSAMCKLSGCLLVCPIKVQDSMERSSPPIWSTALQDKKL